MSQLEYLSGSYFFRDIPFHVGTRYDDMSIILHHTI